MDLHVLVGVGAGVVKQLSAHWDGAPGLGAAPGMVRIVEILNIEIEMILRINEK